VLAGIVQRHWNVPIAPSMAIKGVSQIDCVTCNRDLGKKQSRPRSQSSWMNVDHHGQAFRLSKYQIDTIDLRDINDMSFVLTDALWHLLSDWALGQAQSGSEGALRWSSLQPWSIQITQRLDICCSRVNQRLEGFLHLRKNHLGYKAPCRGFCKLLQEFFSVLCCSKSQEIANTQLHESFWSHCATICIERLLFELLKNL